MIILDTHSLAWWIQQPELLSGKAASAISNADRVGIPAIVFWEIALLQRKGKLALSGGLSAAAWTRRVLSIPRVRGMALTPAIAVAADGLDMPNGPADRLIAATALHFGATLITKDESLHRLAWLDTVW